MQQEQSPIPPLLTACGCLLQASLPCQGGCGSYSTGWCNGNWRRLLCNPKEYTYCKSLLSELSRSRYCIHLPVSPVLTAISKNFCFFATEIPQSMLNMLCSGSCISNINSLCGITQGGYKRYCGYRDFITNCNSALVKFQH